MATRAEQETVLRWDEDAQVVSVWSSSPKTWRRCERLGLRPVRETTAEGQASGKFYRLPVREFRWGRKAKRAGGGNVAALAKARAMRAGDGPCQ